MLKFDEGDRQWHWTLCAGSGFGLWPKDGFPSQNLELNNYDQLVAVITELSCFLSVPVLKKQPFEKEKEESGNKLQV